MTVLHPLAHGLQKRLMATCACACLLIPSWAMAQNEHPAHHRDNALTSTAEQEPKAASAAEQSMAERHAAMAKMDEQMQKMHALHEKMLAAKTPQQRKQLRAEHRKAMEAGMALMGNMSTMGSMPMSSMMGHRKDDMHSGMKDSSDDGMSCPKGSHDMLQKRVQMLESMMQMMMDSSQVPETYGN